MHRGVPLIVPFWSQDGSIAPCSPVLPHLGLRLVLCPSRGCMALPCWALALDSALVRRCPFADAEVVLHRGHVDLEDESVLSLLVLVR